MYAMGHKIHIVKLYTTSTNENIINISEIDTFYSSFFF